QKQVVFSGGEQNSVTDVKDDTWFWSGPNAPLSYGHWTECDPLVACANRPIARSGARMDFDAAAGELVLFGGFNSSNVLQNDTWYWAGAGWCGPASCPTNTPVGLTARCCVDLAYYGDGVQQVILFGGGDTESGTPTTLYGDVWAFNHTPSPAWACKLPP